MLEGMGSAWGCHAWLGTPFCGRFSTCSHCRGAGVSTLGVWQIAWEAGRYAVRLWLLMPPGCVHGHRRAWWDLPPLHLGRGDVAMPAWEDSKCCSLCKWAAPCSGSGEAEAGTEPVLQAGWFSPVPGEGTDLWQAGGTLQPLSPGPL